MSRAELKRSSNAGFGRLPPDFWISEEKIERFGCWDKTVKRVVGELARGEIGIARILGSRASRMVKTTNSMFAIEVSVDENLWRE